MCALHPLCLVLWGTYKSASNLAARVQSGALDAFVLSLLRVSMSIRDTPAIRLFACAAVINLLAFSLIGYNGVMTSCGREQPAHVHVQQNTGVLAICHLAQSR